MARGNPDNLRAAAARKREHATERAEIALRALIKRGAPITFRGVAAEAGCSPDFLYSSPTLRPRIEHLRAQQQATPPPRRRPVATDGPATSNVVRALSTQLTELKKQHHDELAALNAALSAAHGELLQLRRERADASVSASR
jgi:predicted component of type VI protein secretion system